MFRSNAVRACVVTAVLGVGAIPVLAQVGSISIFPTRLILAPQTPSAAVQVKNDSTEEARFQVTLHTWSTSLAGDMDLQPTTDIFAFPTVFIVKPGETRTLRVGTTVPATTIERPYRMVVEELQNEAEAPAASGVRILRRLNIPVFIAPPDRQLRAELTGLELIRPGVVAMHVKNDGTVHFMVGEVRLEGFGATGAVVMSSTRDGWYVLPGADVPYEMTFDPALCAQLTQITATVRLRDVPVAPLVESAPVSRDRCAAR